MLPRYGKNYCIISELATGTIHIEILFQQRVLPPQKFTLQVPENGYRGFLLNKQEQGVWHCTTCNKKEVSWRVEMGTKNSIAFVTK